MIYFLIKTLSNSVAMDINNRAVIEQIQLDKSLCDVVIITLNSLFLC